MMNLAEVKEIKRLARSFRDSGDVSVVTEKYTFESYCNNSPFLSHKGIEFHNGHGVKDVVAFYKGRKLLFILLDLDDRVNISGQYYVATSVPKPYLSGVYNSFFDRFQLSSAEILNPNWYFEDVIFPSRFSGYQEDGKPLFEGDCEICIKDEQGNVFKYSDIEVEKEGDEEENKREEVREENAEEDISI